LAGARTRRRRRPGVGRPQHAAAGCSLHQLSACLSTVGRPPPPVVSALVLSSDCERLARAGQTPGLDEERASAGVLREPVRLLLP
jgi:hypothetical protein